MLPINLQSFWQSIKRDKYLLLAILLGLLLRGLNPTFGSPSLYISNDEAIAHLSALNMISTKTFVSISNYTPLGAYIQIPVLIGVYFLMLLLGSANSIGEFVLFLLTHQGYFLFIPRLISAFFGTLTIITVYKITYILYLAKKPAIIAAVLCAVSFNLVHISHFGRPWAPALFFFTLSVYFALQKKVFLSYLAVALSFGFHQVGILALPLVFWLLQASFSIKNLLKFFFLIVTIITLSKLTLQEGLINAISRNQSLLMQGKFVTDLIAGEQNLVTSFVSSLRHNFSIFFLKNIFVTDAVLFLGIFGVYANLLWRFGNAGNLFWVKRRDTFFFIKFSSYLWYKIRNASDQNKILIYIAVYFLVASFAFHPLIRYLLPIIILSIPVCAFFIFSLTKNNTRLLLIILFLATINALWWNSLFLKKPTFILAYEWINDNLPPEIPIAYVGGRFQTFAPSIEATNRVQSVNAKYGRALQSVLPRNDFNNVRNILYVSNFSGKTKLEQLESATRDYPVSYVIDYYIDPTDRLFEPEMKQFSLVIQFNPTRNGEVTGVPEPLFDASWNFPLNDSRRKVSMYSLNNAGPYVDILKVNY